MALITKNYSEKGKNERKYTAVFEFLLTCMIFT
jgi:hypothetical protein